MEKDVASALEDVRNGSTIRAAARKHRTSNTKFIRRKTNPFPKARGKQPLFQEYDELFLKYLLQGYENFGIPMTQAKFLHVCKELARERGKTLLWFFENSDSDH